MSTALINRMFPTSGQNNQVSIWMHYSVSIGDSRSLLALFRQKLAFMTKRAIIYGAYQNVSEAHRFVFASYTCACFNEISFDKNDQNWNRDLFDCSDLVDITNDRQSYAQYLGVVKVILSGNDREDAAERADAMTRLLLSRDGTKEFIDSAAECMNDRLCGDYHDLEVHDFYSLVCIPCVTLIILFAIS